jgi:hypothetical protein
VPRVELVSVVVKGWYIEWDDSFLLPVQWIPFHLSISRILILEVKKCFIFPWLYISSRCYAHLLFSCFNSCLKFEGWNLRCSSVVLHVFTHCINKQARSVHHKFHCYDPTNHLLLSFCCLWQLHINKTITHLDIMHRLVRNLNQVMVMFILHREHITSPLQAQQINAIYRFETKAY